MGHICTNNPHNKLLKSFKGLALFQYWKMVNTKKYFNLWILKGAKFSNFYELKKKLIFIQIGTTLLLMLTKPHTMTIMSSNRSTWVNGNVVCRSLNFLILPITRSTWIRTLESCLDVSTSPPESCLFLFVKLGILSVAPRVINSSFILKPRSTSIQSSMETLLKKTWFFCNLFIRHLTTPSQR